MAHMFYNIKLEAHVFYFLDSRTHMLVDTQTHAPAQAHTHTPYHLTDTSTEDRGVTCFTPVETGNGFLAGFVL